MWAASRRCGNYISHPICQCDSARGIQDAWELDRDVNGRLHYEFLVESLLHGAARAYNAWGIQTIICGLLRIEVLRSPHALTAS